MFRIPMEWLERADNLAEALAPPGSSFGRTDAFRAAIVKGFESLEGGEEKEWDEIAEKELKLIKQRSEKTKVVVKRGKRK